MRKVLSALCLVSAVSSLTACGTKNQKDSALKITPRNNMVMAMQNAMYGDSVSFANGELELAFEQNGRISFTLNADISIARISMPRQMRISDSYQASPADVMFATYASLADLKNYDHKKGGEVITRFTRLKALDRDGMLGFMVNHFQTGSTGQVLIKQGRNGLVDLVELKLTSDAPIAVSMIDTESTGSYIYDASVGFYRWVEAKLVGILLAGSELSLKAVE